MPGNFVKKVEARKARVAVIGLGYVGLPLACAFARRGFAATGIDIDASKVKRVNAGESYVVDVPSEALRELLKGRRLHATTDYRAIEGVDAVVICVPTPLRQVKRLTPDMSHIEDACRRVARHLRRGQLVVLESTTYPGTTEEVVRPILEKSRLSAEKDFFLAFSPERVDPGNKQYDTASIPKVLGGVGPRSTAAAKALYASVIQRVVPVSSARTAEMVKLLENTFRSVNIGLINEMAMICHRLGVDIWEVVEAAKTKPFGFMPFYPGPGLGGHCLPIDPLYLSWKSRRHGHEAKMIDLAASINENMPFYVVERVAHLLSERRTALKGAPVLVLGAAYKPDVDDARESPSVDVIDHLAEEGARVSYCDPYIPALRTARGVLRARRLTPALLQRQRCVVVLTAHSAFDYATVVKHSKLVLDTRNALRRWEKEPHVSFL